MTQQRGEPTAQDLSGSDPTAPVDDFDADDRHPGDLGVAAEADQEYQDL